MDRVGRQSPTVSVILPYTDTKGQEAGDLYSNKYVCESNLKNGYYPCNQSSCYTVRNNQGEEYWRYVYGRITRTIFYN